MSERPSYHEPAQEVYETPLSVVPSDAAPTLIEQHAHLSALYDKATIAEVIDALYALQEWQDNLGQLQDRISSVESGIEQIDTAALELDKDAIMIGEAIAEARRRIEAANAELDTIRDQTAILEDTIDALNDKTDEKSIRLREAHRATLAELHSQKNTQRTIRQLQGRAIQELEQRLTTVNADVAIEKTAHTSSRAQYVEQAVILDRRLDYLSNELGKVASAATTIIRSAQRVIDMPELGALPPLPGRLQLQQPVVVVDGAPAYRLSDNPTNVWLHSEGVARSVPVYFKMPEPLPDIPEPPEQEAEEEPDASEDRLPYGQIYQQLTHQRPRLTPPNGRTVSLRITKPIKK